MKLATPLIAGLDVDTDLECLRIADLIHDQVGAFKIGPRLSVRYGQKLIQELSLRKPVFIDNKYLDIPNTMESAVRASFDAGASLTTVHAWAGPEALARIAKVEAELNQIRPFKILVVTVLTSFSQATLPERLQAVEIAEQVVELASSAARCGLSGFVCSPFEVAELRRRTPTGFFVTPGVRLADQDRGDQKRVLTPKEAIDNGTSAFVIARPLVESSDPTSVAKKILQSLEPS